MRRKNPWHLRTPNTEHYQWFRNLVDLNRLTVAWRLKTRTEHLSSLFEMKLSRKVQENLWMLGNLLDTNIMDATLEQFLDDTAPEDVLGRLNHVVWAVQAGTLGIILNSTDSPEFMDLLEESSWKLGRSCVETRWSALTQKGSQDLRDIVLALQDSPLSGYPFMNGYLVKRATHKEIQIELESCPHRSQFAELQPVAASLCNLHSHWIRGYTSGLNSKIKVTHEQGPRKCLQRWTLN